MFFFKSIFTTFSQDPDIEGFSFRALCTVQVRNDEEEWERIRTNHEGLLWETRTSFYKQKVWFEEKNQMYKTCTSFYTEKYDLRREKSDI